MPSFPTIFEWIDDMSFLRGQPAAYLAIAAASVIVIFWEWRLALLALTVNYLAATLLFIEVLDPRLAIVKLFVGLFICLMLYFTARQATNEHPSAGVRSAAPSSRKWLARSSLPFRSFLTLLVILTVLSLSRGADYRLPAVPAAINLAVYGLVALGLLGIALGTNPLQVGMSILLLMAGFELFYNTLDQSITVLGLLAVANLLLTLAVAYLAQLDTVRAAPFEGARQSGANDVVVEGSNNRPPLS